MNLRITENNEYHWMHLLFIAHVYIDFQIIDRAVSIYQNILKFGHENFSNWPYLHSQMAIAHHNKRGKNGKHNLYSVNEIFNHYFFIKIC